MFEIKWKHRENKEKFVILYIRNFYIVHGKMSNDILIKKVNEQKVKPFVNVVVGNIAQELF